MDRPARVTRKEAPLRPALSDAITPKAVLTAMERVADWQLENPSRHRPDDWTEAAGYTGMMALAGISADRKYRDAMVAMGEANCWKPGRRVYHADDHCVGQTYAELYLHPLKETSSSGFYTYALAWGVNQGLLDRRSYEPAVRKAWTALVSCVTNDGKLTHVQPIGADPQKFPDDSTEVYGSGAFLLAGSEIHRMAVKSR